MTSLVKGDLCGTDESFSIGKSHSAEKHEGIENPLHFQNVAFPLKKRKPSVWKKAKKTA